MRETDDLYIFLRHQFGQWTLRDMQAPDGTIYNCCEQYMMQQKALICGDVETAVAIMAEADPGEQKKLGRLVKGFDAPLWDKYKYGVVWYGNFLKFTQHQDLAERLLKTESKVLVEANPVDPIWGVGLAASDDAILDPANWKGQNLLGQVLMSVRDAIGH